MKNKIINVQLEVEFQKSDTFWDDANRNTMLLKLKHNFFIAWSWSFGKEHWLGTIKAAPKKTIFFFLKKRYLICQQSDRNGGDFFKFVVIFYYTGPNLLTLKVGTYLNELSCTLLFFFFSCFAQAEKPWMYNG